MDDQYFYEDEKDEEVPDDLFDDLKEDSVLWDIKLAAIAGLAFSGIAILSNFFLEGIDFSRVLISPIGIVIVLSLVLYITKERLVAVALFAVVGLLLVFQIINALRSMLFPVFGTSIFLFMVTMYFLRKGVNGAFEYHDRKK